jgi:hypothetical protein
MLITIINAFKEAGLKLESYSDVNLLQYDGYDYGNNILIQLNTGINGHNKPALFGDYHSNSGQVYSISGAIDDWMENFGEYLPYMAKGEDFDW